MNGTARTTMAGSVHHPACAAITPPVAATENNGPTLDTESGTKSHNPNDCFNDRASSFGGLTSLDITLFVVLKIISLSFRQEYKSPTFVIHVMLIVIACNKNGRGFKDGGFVREIGV